MSPMLDFPFSPGVPPTPFHLPTTVPFEVVNTTTSAGALRDSHADACKLPRVISRVDLEVGPPLSPPKRHVEIVEVSSESIADSGEAVACRTAIKEVMVAIMHIIHKENGNGSEGMGMLLPASRNMLKEMQTLSSFMQYEEQLKVAIASRKLMFVLQLLNEVGLQAEVVKPPFLVLSTLLVADLLLPVVNLLIWVVLYVQEGLHLAYCETI
ncbi:hypothetical protein SELMODRAFT_409813 [Selaginella moellendorffii]|uniref:Uncharacterized protein n=1 Tax=Selaginella moellendorffii TaxID=88036 RepID=D8RCI9_SELML|nr:hypothetical protein SELMODRAFT_409813 [Selaginella moellendorffii]